MQFRVPQFIDIEDKILGPLSWTQFAYCLGAAGIGYICFRFIDSKTIAIIVSFPFVATFLALAFVKINNQSFVDVAKNAVNYFTRSNMYTWQKDRSVTPVRQTQQPKQIPVTNINKKSLSDIASGLDTKIGETKK